MDSVPATALPPLTADDYRGLGRNQAAFWASQANAANAAKARDQAQGTDETSLGFKDVLDLINPLEHLPIISNVYHAIVGESTAKPAVKLVGDAVYGGPLGMLSGGVDAIIKQASGKDMVETVAGWFGHEKSTDGIDTKLADAAIQPGAAPANADANQIALADIQWNQPAAITKPIPNFGLASAAPLPPIANLPAAGAPIAPAQTAEAAPSPFFQSLQKGAPQQAVAPQATQKAFFNPMAKQFNGVQPVAFKTPEAANVDTVQNPSGFAEATPDKQSDFAKKMMDALDRYEATKKIGAPEAAPGVINQGL